MAKAKELNESYRVGYTARDRKTNDDIINLEMNWENRDLEDVKKNLNTWLTAIGLPLDVVDKK
jgi:hypothetical protein